MRFSFGIAPSLGDEDMTPFAFTVPSAVGLSSSRYTFNKLSFIAWLGIVLGGCRWEFPRIHLVCIWCSMNFPVTFMAKSKAVAQFPSQIGMIRVGLDVVRVKFNLLRPAFLACRIVSAYYGPSPCVGLAWTVFSAGIRFPVGVIFTRIS